MTSKLDALLVLILITAPLGIPLAHADDLVSHETARRTVRVETAGTFEPSDAFEETVRELLGRVGLHLAVGDAPASDADLARVRIEHDDDGATIRVEDARGISAPLVRRLKRQGSPAVFREALAHVVLAAVEPLRESPPPPVTRTPPEPPTTAPPVVHPLQPRQPSASPPSLWALEIGTQFGAGTFGSGSVVVPTVAAALTGRYRRGARWGGAVLFRYGLPFETGDEAVSTRVSSYSPRLIPVLELASFQRVAFDVGAGIGADVLVVSPRSAVLPSSLVRSSTTRVDPIVTGALTARVGLAPGIDLSLAFTVDADLADRRWVFEAGPIRETIFSPWRVRPFVAIGLDVTVAGPSRTKEPAR